MNGFRCSGVESVFTPSHLILSAASLSVFLYEFREISNEIYLYIFFNNQTIQYIESLPRSLRDYNISIGGLDSSLCPGAEHPEAKGLNFTRVNKSSTDSLCEESRSGSIGWS